MNPLSRRTQMINEKDLTEAVEYFKESKDSDVYESGMLHKNTGEGK